MNSKKIIFVFTCLVSIVKPSGTATTDVSFYKYIQTAYKCPRLTRRYPEIAFSPFDLHDGINNQQSVKIIPFSVKIFSKLGMVPLSNNELCIRGEKLKNFLLPRDRTSQFQVLTGIAIWFSHCIQIPEYSERNVCYNKQKLKLEALDWKSILSLQDLISKYINQF